MSAREAPLTMVQPCLKDASTPPEVRLGFVKKVYGILCAMMVCSFSIVSPFVLYPDEADRFMEANPWIPALCCVLLLAHQVFNMIMVMQMCCGSNSCMQRYLKMFVTVPWNYLFLFTYATCFGVLTGLICAEYTAPSVCLVFALTAIMMAALTVYAVYTKNDFTGCGMYFFALIVGLMMFAVVDMFVHSEILHKCIAVGGTVLFSFIIIHDTQLIFGTSSLDLNSSAARRIEFTVDMYAFAAYQLYLDFMNMFFYLLQLLGERRN